LAVGSLMPGSHSCAAKALHGDPSKTRIKQLIFLAGWHNPLPKIRYRQGKAFELKNEKGQTYCFHEHITAHTMRRTAITTLLMLGVEENAVRRISGHALGSKEFYKYVGLVQAYLNSSVRSAHAKLMGIKKDPIL